MKKKLRTSTIIPPNLYVHRDADRQLKDIIDDMGRPGYILVARQMGKTNLLINAKRELENIDNVFVYIDLSKSFDTAKDCFRSIIDTILETNEKILNTIINGIGKSRSENEYPAHKEHEIELRKILKSIPGKLVIILDEIDALKNTDFSDQVFSLIRSIYFSRVNYQEYERLTYVLSGVAEPSEIIKDKNISPFNIGQKIYLNDFNEGEYKEFLNLANINVSKNVESRIYEWTKGNPRTTWDICSEIEDHLIAGELVTIESVDKIVKKMYLVQFNKAPIDHIRDLVENSREIRNAVLQILYGKGIKLSDDIKSKLYLSGIIGSNFEAEKIVLKNKLLEAALNEKWLEDLERKNRSLINLADDQYNSNNYRKAIELYNEYLENAPENETPTDFTYLNIGNCFYELGEYDSAIDYFIKTEINKSKYGAVYYDNVYKTGVSYLIVANYKKSIELFDEYINYFSEGSFYYESLLNKTSACFNYDYDKYKKYIIDVNNKVIGDAKKLSVGNADEIITKASLNLARAYKNEEDFDESYNLYLTALDTADITEKPYIYMEAYKVSPNSDIKIEIANKAIDYIIEKDINISEYNVTKSLSYNENVFLELLLASYNDSPEYFDKLIDYEGKMREGITSANLLNICGNLAVNRQKIDLGVSFYNRVITEGDQEEDYYLNSSKNLAYLKGSDNPELRKQYFELLKSRGKEILLDDLSLTILINYIAFEMNDGDNNNDAEECIKYVRKQDKEQGVKHNNLLLILFLEMSFLNKTNRMDKAADVASEIKNFWSADDPIWSSGESPSDLLQYIKSQIYAPNKVSRVTPIKSSKKYGRNDIVRVKYSDGNIVDVKYKKVADDINNNICEIVE